MRYLVKGIFNIPNLLVQRHLNDAARLNLRCVERPVVESPPRWSAQFEDCLSGGVHPSVHPTPPLAHPQMFPWNSKTAVVKSLFPTTRLSADCRLRCRSPEAPPNVSLWLAE